MKYLAPIVLPVVLLLAGCSHTTAHQVWPDGGVTDFQSTSIFTDKKFSDAMMIRLANGTVIVWIHGYDSTTKGYDMMAAVLPVLVRAFLLGV